MVFRAQLDPVIYATQNRASACRQTASLDRIVAQARALHPSGSIDYVRTQPDRGVPVAVRFLDKDTLYFDRCTAAPVASQNRYQGFFGTLEWIHRGIWLRGGNILMGTGALALILALAVIGIFLWWPRRPRRFRQGFVLNRKLKGPAFNLGLHRTIGAWVALPLLISATTGLPNAFDGLKAAIMSIGGPAVAHRIVSHQDTAAPRADASLDAVWQTITRLAPNPQEVLIHLPVTASSPIEIYIIEAGAPHANARTYLYLDQYSGGVLDYAPYRSSPIGSKLYYWLLSIHTGQVGGIAGQLFLFVGAIGMIGLGYTGMSSYLRRRIKQARTKRVAKAKFALSIKT